MSCAASFGTWVRDVTRARGGTWRSRDQLYIIFIYNIYLDIYTGAAFLWDMNQGRDSRRLGGHGGHVTSCSWLHGQLFMTGAQDGKVRMLYE